MEKTVKIIEFACIHLDTETNILKKVKLAANRKTVISIDVEQIVGIVPLDGSISKLLLKDGKEFFIVGTHRTLTNRWVYALNLKINLYEDSILRPSVLIYHRSREIKHDNGFLDKNQLEHFILALKPELLELEHIKDALNE